MKTYQRDLFTWKPTQAQQRNTHMDLFAEIKRMADRPAGCFARVKYFAGKFGVCVRTIKGWLRKLKDQGLLKVEHHGPRGAVMKALAAAVAPIVAPIQKLSSYINSSRGKGDACAEKLAAFPEWVRSAAHGSLELAEKLRSQAEEIIRKNPHYARRMGLVA